MTKSELFEKHHEKCKNCKKEDKCEGIYITINNTTKCEEGENIEDNNSRI